jgi:YD repeat-containing protein
MLGSVTRFEAISNEALRSTMIDAYPTTTSDKVSAVTVAGGTWAYGYGTNSTTVTNPASQAKTTNYTSAGLVTSILADGKTTQFGYCGGGSFCPTGLLETVIMSQHFG